MKKYIIVLILFINITACKKERPTLEPAGSKVEGIQDDWKLFRVMQYDEISQKELDVSSVYIGKQPMVLTFKISGTDTAYTNLPGTSVNYLGENGTWHFDNNEFPTTLTIRFDGNDHILKLNRTVRPQDQTLEFKFSKVCHGKRVVSYNYTFKRM